MTTFVLDQDIGCDIEIATFKEAIRKKTWRNGRVAEQGVSSGNTAGIEKAVREDGLQNVVPVGSIEFIQEFCKSHKVAPVQAMNLPDELLLSNFPLGRNIWRDLTKSEFSQLPNATYLLKPSKTPKRFAASLYKPTDTVPDNIIPDDEPLFVQEYIKNKFYAEWRLFVQNGEILALRPYFIDQHTWAVPDRHTCEAMAKLLSNYPAITLDVAVIENSPGMVTIPIEAHPFLACGLYGWEDDKILTLARSAWADHLLRQAML